MLAFRRGAAPLLAVALLVCACGAAAESESAASCGATNRLAVQVLGSGGPIADDGRASAGYVVWVDGQSRVLIDAGGGSFLRFAEAGADFTELDAVGLSHFHTDHSVDFAALLKSGNFSNRERELVVAGPDAGGPFPGLNAWLSALLDRETGAFGYLAGYLDGTGGLAPLLPVEVTGDAVVPVFESESGDLVIDAMHVPHGIVPALGFRVRVGDATLVFASDQNGSDPDFIAFADGADLLIMHFPIPESATGGALQLHAKPSTVGEVAQRSQADTLLLSHFMARSLRNLEANVAQVRDAYDGSLILAEDLMCIAIESG